jgi:hypothetical protein
MPPSTSRSEKVVIGSRTDWTGPIARVRHDSPRLERHGRQLKPSGPGSLRGFESEIHHQSRRSCRPIMHQSQVETGRDLTDLVAIVGVDA